MSKFASHPTILVCAALFIFALLYRVEGKWQHMPFIGFIVLALFGIGLLFSKRVAFSVYLSLMIVCMTTLMSIAKFRGKGFGLHIYDLAFTGSDAEALKFLAAEFSGLVVPIIAAVILAIIGLSIFWRNDRVSQKKLPIRALPLILACISLPLAYPIKWSEPRYFYYLAGFNASSFYISFLDIVDRFSGEPMIANVKLSTDASAFSDAYTCDTMATKPDIYVVLSESATDFERHYPQINIEAAPVDAFRSEDGKKRELRVETFAGGTWVSNFSFMTGLSSLDFGWRAPYLTMQLQDKINQSMATVLKDCGYRTAVVMPMKHSFVNEGPFLESIGFDEVLSYDDIGAMLYNHRDDFYFNAANQFIDAHQANDKRPLFVEVQTMFAHSPFRTPRETDIQFQKFPYTDDRLLNEHIRRVYIAQNDFHDFIAQRKRAQPDRPFIVVEFGDHQTARTQPLADDLAGSNSLLDRNSAAYKAHYSVHSYQYDLDMGMFPDAPLDISFLAVTFMQAANIPLTPMYADLAALRDLCEGRFDDCQHRDAVNTHIARRIKSGFLSLPNS